MMDERKMRYLINRICVRVKGRQTVITKLKQILNSLFFMFEFRWNVCVLNMERLECSEFSLYRWWWCLILLGG